MHSELFLPAGLPNRMFNANTCSRLIVIILLGGFLSGCELSSSQSAVQEKEASSMSEHKVRISTGLESYVLDEAEFARLQREALLGSAESALRLANYLEMVKLDHINSEYWFTIASENGSLEAMYTLANILIMKGTNQAKLRATYWLDQIAQSGNGAYRKRARKMLAQIKAQK